MATAAAALAHDVWIQPRQFWIQPGGTAATEVWVGHGSFRDRWGVANDRVLLLRSFGPGGAIDHRPELRPGSLAGITLFGFPNAGTQLLAMESSHALSDLPSIRYTDYAKSEGLTLPLAARVKAGTTDRNGRETYSRRAKALIQVGPPSVRSPDVTKPVGLTLEIVPEANPYTLAADAALPVRVLFNGRPLPGATVKLNNLAHDDKPVAVRLTDAAGRARFAFPRAGDWQLNVIWSVPVAGNPDADFDTTFSSLTFGFPTRLPG